MNQIHVCVGVGKKISHRLFFLVKSLIEDEVLAKKRKKGVNTKEKTKRNNISFIDVANGMMENIIRYNTPISSFIFAV